MSSIILIDSGPEGEVCAQTLRAQGHEVRVAQNGEEALNLAAAHRPDLITAIDAMPVVDNVSLLDLLNATPSLQGIAMVIMNLNRSTNGQPGVTRMYNRFYDDMLTPDQLTGTVNEVLAKHVAVQAQEAADMAAASATVAPQMAPQVTYDAYAPAQPAYDPAPQTYDAAPPVYDPAQPAYDPTQQSYGLTQPQDATQLQVQPPIQPQSPWQPQG